MSYVPNVMRAVNFMERNLVSPISVADVASQASYSTFHFVRLFKTLTGETPGGYLRRHRLAEAVRELTLNRKRIIEIALDYQFQSQEALARALKGSFGIAPSAFRKKGAVHLQYRTWKRHPCRWSGRRFPRPRSPKDAV
jgi:AraC family transcriptional regulator